MDEYSRGMDPEIKKYFRKIINSFSFGLLWLLGIVTAGIFFQLAMIRDGIKWYNVIFYLAATVSLAPLIRFYLKTWK